MHICTRMLGICIYPKGGALAKAWSAYFVSQKELHVRLQFMENVYVPLVTSIYRSFTNFKGYVAQMLTPCWSSFQPGHRISSSQMGCFPYCAIGLSSTGLMWVLGENRHLFPTVILLLVVTLICNWCREYWRNIISCQRCPQFWSKSPHISAMYQDWLY